MPFQTTSGKIGSKTAQTSSGTSATKSVSFIAGASQGFQLYIGLRQLTARVLSGSSKDRQPGGPASARAGKALRRSHQVIRAPGADLADKTAGGITGPGSSTTYGRRGALSSCRSLAPEGRQSI